MKRGCYTKCVKPAADRWTAFIMLVVMSPFLLIIIFALFLFNGGNIWFIQQRPGKDGKPFKVVKFRTMTDRRDSNGDLLPDDLRLTAIGRWIRRTSLDELPQLFNVVRGDMSFIGPRPLLMEYVPLYNAFQQRRMEVLPGITGWAQINGRNTISWQEKFELDVWYVDHQSFLLDIKILFLTVFKVFKAEGISGPGTETMKKFDGNK